MTISPIQPTTTQVVQIWVGMLTGIAGLVLGLLNWLQRHRETKPRIRVRPIVRIIVSSIKEEPNETVALMELANIGRVTVHGNVVGFSGSTKKGGFIKHPSTIDGTKWPRGIEPGTTCHLRIDIETAAEALKNATLNRAFLSAQTGEIYQSSKKDMREFRDAVAKEMAERASKL